MSRETPPLPWLRRGHAGFSTDLHANLCCLGRQQGGRFTHRSTLDPGEMHPRGLSEVSAEVGMLGLVEQRRCPRGGALAWPSRRPPRVSVQPVDLREPFRTTPGALVPCHLPPEPTLSLLDMQETRLKGREPLSPVAACTALGPHGPLSCFQAWGSGPRPAPFPPRTWPLGLGALPPEALQGPGVSADSVASSLLRKSEENLAAPTSRHLQPLTVPPSLSCGWVVVPHGHLAPLPSPTQGHSCGVSPSLLAPSLHPAPVPSKGDHGGPAMGWHCLQAPGHARGQNKALPASSCSKNSQ